MIAFLRFSELAVCSRLASLNTPLYNDSHLGNIFTNVQCISCFHFNIKISTYLSLQGLRMTVPERLTSWVDASQCRPFANIQPASIRLLSIKWRPDLTECSNDSHNHPSVLCFLFRTWWILFIVILFNFAICAVIIFKLFLVEYLIAMSCTVRSCV